MQLGPTKREARVLITVKASPQPSATYGDTVCVAGVELDGTSPVRLIRLYPVPFRHMTGEHTFKKYEIVSVIVDKASNDPRPESHKIDAASFQVEQALPPWRRRIPYIEPLIEGSMCALLNDIRRDPNAKSLAIIRPQEIKGLAITEHPGWTAKQASTLRAWANQGDLFDASERAMIEAPRFEAKYRYRCKEPSCKGHTQGLLDWELTALQRGMAHRSDDELVDAIRHNFFEVVRDSTRAPAFFVGNQADPVRRGTFSVLGVYYPKATEASMGTLF